MKAVTVALLLAFQWCSSAKTLPDYGLEDWGPFPDGMDDFSWGEYTADNSTVEIQDPFPQVKIKPELLAAKCDRSDLCSSGLDHFPVCHCDDKCREYGDCCLETLDERSPPVNEIWQCLPISNDGYQVLLESVSVYMKANCPDGSDEELTAKCRRHDVGNRDAYSHVMDIPVFSRNTGIFYANFFCAQCYDDALDLLAWNVTVRCDSESVRNNLSQLVSSGEAKYVPGERHWVLNQTRNDCRWDIEDDGNLLSFVEIVGGRQCRKSIDHCPVDWLSSDDKDKCRSYTSYVETEMSQHQVFKNWHCATCNGVPPEKIHCYSTWLKDLASSVPTLPHQITKQLNFSSQKCGNDEELNFLLGESCPKFASPVTKETPVAQSQEIIARNRSFRLERTETLLAIQFTELYVKRAYSKHGSSKS